MRKTFFLRLNKNCRQALFLAFIGVLAFAVLFSPVQRAFVASASAEKTEKVIILDPGHGGADPGAIGVNKALEKDINLSIALFLKDMLLADGYKVIMTRETDISIHDKDKKGTSAQKVSDIKNRLKIMNEHEDVPVLLIHQNEFSQEKYSGAQMFFGKKNPKSKELAKCMQESFCELLQPKNQREIKKGTSSVYLLCKAQNPIILAECGFLSNYKESELLSDEEYRKKVAFVLFCGVSSYYQEN